MNIASPDDAPGVDPALRPREARVGLALLCEVRQGTRPWWTVRLDDLSQQGFRLARFPHVSHELPIKIRIPGMQLLAAEIRWHSDSALGCAFTEPLHVAVFEHVVKAARGGF